MKVLFPALRVRELDRSLSFYAAVGFEVVGQVDRGDGRRLVMLALPGESEVSLELVHSSNEAPAAAGGLDHLAVQVEDLDATRAHLVSAELDAGPVERPGGPDGPHTASVVDPDGYRLELVQWPSGHPTGMTRAELAPTLRTRRLDPDDTRENTHR